MELRPGDTHYFTLYDPTTGLTIANFTYCIVRNGVSVELPLTLLEIKPTFYMFRFVNDGTVGQWELVVHVGAGNYYRHWLVRPDLTAPALIRIKNDTERLLRNKRKED